MTQRGGRQRFRRSDRLRSSKDYRRVSRDGVRMSSRSFVVLVAPQREADPGAPPKLGITVSRRVGNAVVRASVKRRLREWFRLHRDQLPVARDLVVIARPAAAGLSAAEVDRELARALRRFSLVENQ
ncbi:ribonuclease P protein component [Myxococcota bacterium]|nr:ribonuclease P protein component [Myxococcota bacterium]MCZ7617360.1 ribonuclease P protein component [Myxococcota bacterium]